jgi:murein DD-endopeptidase MepM/ murein hydrolase activator NlpD/outer membrane lipoprotein-sorting protein
MCGDHRAALAMGCVMAKHAIGVVLVATLCLPSSAQQALTAQQIVDKAFVAMGGRQGLAAIHTETAKGRVELLGGFPGTYELWAEAPNKLKTAWDIGYIQQERAFDGNKGWEKNASVRELVGRDLQHLQRASIFNLLLKLVQDDTPAARQHDQTIPHELPLHSGDFSSNAAKSEGRQSPTKGLTGQEVYVVEFSPAHGEHTTFYFDKESFLPLRQSYPQPYDEGDVQVTINYGDYRKVDGLMLPFAITVVVPDLPLVIHIGQYQFNKSIEESIFENPLSSHASDPYEVTLETIPRYIYLENDGPWSTGWIRSWGIPFVPTESWLFNLVVNEKYGRYLDPVAASLEFYSRGIFVRRVTFSQAALESMQKFPVTRFSPQPEIFDFRHYGSEARVPGVDRLVYKLQLKSPSGETIDATKDIPLTHYKQTAKLIFPIKGNFIVPNGHEFYELAHKYEWSQQYAYDIVGLGPNFELKKDTGTKSEDFVTYATREILAPADGTVVYARNNDVPDDMRPEDYLRAMPDPISAIGGNLVIIDHGHGEYSLFAHMHKGSVRVKVGDRVKQGQIIALMGSAGSPGVPHLHYQLQAGPGVFSSDGLPSEFENIEWVGWLGNGETIRIPKRGVYFNAK